MLIGSEPIVISELETNKSKLESSKKSISTLELAFAVRVGLNVTVETKWPKPNMLPSVNEASALAEANEPSKPSLDYANVAGGAENIFTTNASESSAIPRLMSPVVLASPDIRTEFTVICPSALQIGSSKKPKSRQGAACRIFMVVPERA